jgi:hypothetical protein
VGVQLLQPGSIFDSSPSFAQLQRMIPESVLAWLFLWGWLAGTVGLYTRWDEWQLKSAFALSLLYAYFGGGLYWANPSGLGGVTYLAIGGHLVIAVCARLWQGSRGES